MVTLDHNFSRKFCSAEFSIPEWQNTKHITKHELIFLLLCRLHRNKPRGKGSFAKNKLYIELFKVGFATLQKCRLEGSFQGHSGDRGVFKIWSHISHSIANWTPQEAVEQNSDTRALTLSQDFVSKWEHARYKPHRSALARQGRRRPRALKKHGNKHNKQSFFAAGDEQSGLSLTDVQKMELRRHISVWYKNTTHCSPCTNGVVRFLPALLRRGIHVSHRPWCSPMNMLTL